MKALRRLTISRRLGAQKFSVVRTVLDYSTGNEVPVETTILMAGIIYPSREKEILMQAVGDRLLGAIKVITQTQLIVTGTTTDSDGNEINSISDKVIWNNLRFKIMSSFPFSDYGVYISIGQRENGC
jgi:hypothetical protein